MLEYNLHNYTLVLVKIKEKLMKKNTFLFHKKSVEKVFTLLYVEIIESRRYRFLELEE